ncbi:MAG: cbb3-type cytochrome c oxidase subunit I [Oligoflexia bacterium]|nr:cbb3-type cytochrome c oxidase subunit I [Oligoflexia bacterium]
MSVANSDVNYINSPKGLWSWLVTIDHKRIGIMYLFTTLAFFALGGIFALLLRIEHLTPGRTIMDANQYNIAFTLHGAIMVFMFIVPNVPAAFGNFFLPIMIGAKDVAFPKINLLSYYVFWLGAILAVCAIIFGGVDTGWTFYTPYSIRTNTAVIFMASGAFIMGMSSILTGLNFIVTVHKLRAPGMTFFHLPLFIWGIYATAIIQVLATPVIGMTVALLIMERVFGIGFFDPALGGDPILFQHFFWFYSHPAVYIMIVPGMAIISEIIPAFSKKTIFGYKPIAYSSLAIAFASFIVWGHHMFTSGQSYLASLLFSVATIIIGVPTAIKIVNWVATMYKGKVSWETPMLYAMAFIFMFSIGGLTGLFHISLAVSVHLHDTYFVVAHFHYVMMGGTVMAMLGGLHYWWPKMFGVMYNECLGKIGAALMFIGFNMTFGSQFIMGNLGMPRRYYDYAERFQPLHQVSTVGSWFIAASFLLTMSYLIYSLFKGKKAPANPWDAKSLEWTIASPPPTENFLTDPVVTEPYPYGTPNKARSHA